MEKENSRRRKNCAKNGLVKQIQINWPDNLTTLDLSNKNITEFDDNIVFPPNLTELDVSHNNLEYIPSAVLNLGKINSINLSYNSIQYFDETPCFCHSVEELNLSHNKLEGPPYWVWTESPEKLAKINLSHNINLTKSLTEEYYEELLQYKSLATEVLIFNCRIRDHIELIGTMPAVKSLEFGVPDLSKFMNNNIMHIPCKGLQNCCDIERLNLSNTSLFSIEPKIDMFKRLVEINLSYNNISNIPNSFCNLESLEICILSFNNILYLPEDMVKLKNLVCLKIDSNKLCMLPENLCTLPKLRILDLYDNGLYEVENEVIKIGEMDLAQNYLEEPESKEYLKKKEMLRLNASERLDGRKEEPVYAESEHSSGTTDDEELLEYLNDPSKTELQEARQLSSPEDWDSDEYWIPHYFNYSKPQNPWLHYVRAKMKEGNFCPMDLHTESATEMVKRERQCNPKQWIFVQGQFDDISDDDS